ncbi:unnamed protein product [Orchesella dallaii]|uniref:Chitin-binding type-2 domain-containing protein n=1 Tax=Orchesella dallaii TaxID=48710 RepID=A0ABP1PZ31_9HEXA
MQKSIIVASFEVYVFVVICATSAVSVLRGSKDIDLSVLKAPPSCELGRNYMEGQVPDPFNCHQFYICAPAEGNITAAQKMECPSDLFFSFRTCQCEFYDSDCCISCSNLEFFNCTKVYDPSIPTEKVGLQANPFPNYENTAL